MTYALVLPHVLNMYFLRIVKQQLVLLKAAVESKLKGALSSSKSHSGSCDNFHAAFSYTLPATSHNSTIPESALWALSKTIREERNVDKGEIDEADDAREAVLIKTRPMTADEWREWASSASEKKEVYTAS